MTEKKAKSREFSRSLFVVKDIKLGETFTKKNVRSIRPGYGMAPKYSEIVFGSIASQDIKRGTPLEWIHLKNS
jgi:pseudaminic acid synthase